MRYRDVENWTKFLLDNLRKPDGSPVYTLRPMVSPGPASDLLAQKLTPNELVFITVGGGSPQTNEGLFDRPLIEIRVIGKQANYHSAEDLAHYIDNGLLAIDSMGLIGSARVMPIARSGGAPILLMRDDANRYHFTCSYIAETLSEIFDPSVSIGSDLIYDGDGFETRLDGTVA